MQKLAVIAVWLSACSWLGAAEPPLPAPLPAAVDFNRHIKPILSQHCIRCHGPDKQESGLRVDLAQSIRTGGGSGPAVVAGQPDKSLLLQAVSGADDVSEMPPEGPRLAAAEIALLRTWVASGAAVPATEAVVVKPALPTNHWAFQPLRQPTAPPVQQADWVRNPLDRFVLAELEAAGLQPSPEADRATLIRRVSLDLLGLLPSVTEVDDFVDDPRPTAYEHVVDRLLASPHYGERWGRHWLDQARYADSNGYTIDGGRSIWKYRDWVIGALNRDLPFDQFTIEQLAGDLLPNPTLDQQIATGFHRNTLVNEEGGSDPEQFRVEAVADRVSTTASVFLGLTLGCARCHDHKYDPLSQREYYQFFAFFNTCLEPTLQVPTDKQSSEEPALLADIADGERRLADVDANSNTRQREWEKQFAHVLEVQWTPLDPLEAHSLAGAKLSKLDDRSILVGGKIPAHDTVTLAATSPLTGVTAIRLEALPHESLPVRGPGWAANGNFVLSEIRLEVPAENENGGPTWTPVEWAAAHAEHSQAKYPVEHAIDAEPNTGWAIGGADAAKPNPARAAVFVSSAPVGTQGQRLRITLLEQHADAKYLLGRFRLSVTTAPPDALRLSAPLREALRTPADRRTAEQRKLLLSEFQKSDPERVQVAGQLQLLKDRLKHLQAKITSTLVLQEMPKPRQTFIHLRGDFLRPGAVVSPGVPAILPKLVTSAGAPTRLDLARWLVDGRNPLPPRVTVNRVWQHYFGQGLVITESDFGTQGTPPTHPALLDWLAAELIARQWSMKALHRTIVTSATYRQASRFRPELAAADPYNKLLGRQARLRLEAEIIRDAALSASGLLTREIGGPGVYPPQPQGVYRFTQRSKYWKESTGPDRYRRSMYTYFWRSSPFPLLTTFDAPDANVTCTRRVQSNTPLQALTLANDRGFFELAQGLAGRVLKDAPANPAERLKVAFRICLSRLPEPREEAVLLEFVQQQQRQFAADPLAAERAAPPQRAVSMDTAEAAAWTAVARVLLNLDEFITRE